MSVSDPVRRRSWLFVPADSERKFARALASEADVILLDLEDAIAESEKPTARRMARDMLQGQPDQTRRVWVRINPLHTMHALLDLATIMPAAPAGIMLPKVRSRSDVEKLSHFLSAFEAASGREEGVTRIIIVATETAEALYQTHSYAGIARLTALTWGAEDLATAIGAISNRAEDGTYSFPYQMARSLCVTGSAVAGVAAIETMHGDFRDMDGLACTAVEARKAGFQGMIAIHPDQVSVINHAFTPTAAELAEAQEIVALFAANPQAGTLGFKGQMLDRPHLLRAQAVLTLGAAA
ncbi:CoA ester lyase [Sphingomonas sp. C3-2]|uniref:HpcH/HpaI aldolase/citrate lyase family protein n=1 Tax=Sphingomonas sp. C3-2 TaxID=3062169 RepID=UPI00294B61FB|nr:CoA ester lyase [Sphingomonas sp. C3-2]WOK36689.1 CoA ester lyase [Sphingomonas sp. C3-2]